MSLLTILPTPAAGASGLPLLLSPRPTLNAADIAAIVAAVWADPVAVSAHAKLDAILARITC